MEKDLSLEDFSKFRNKIATLLNKSTNGEITDIDFFVDYLSRGKGIVTIMLSVPAKIKKKYDGDVDSLMDKHLDTVRQVLTSTGFGSLFSKTIIYQVL